jgi:hypothetical protein
MDVLPSMPLLLDLARRDRFFDRCPRAVAKSLDSVLRPWSSWIRLHVFRALPSYTLRAVANLFLVNMDSDVGHLLHAKTPRVDSRSVPALLNSSDPG